MNSMQLESGFDFVKWGFNGDESAWLTGNVYNTWLVFDTQGGSLESTRGNIRFTTDITVGGPGFQFSQLSFCTTRTTRDTSAAQWQPGNVHVGALFGPGDYVMFQGDSYLRFEGGGPADFDLYARCNAPPNDGQWDFRGYSADSQEFIDVTGCQGTLYVAAHSHSGSGVFSVVLNNHEPTQGHTTLMRAGTNFNALPGEMSTFTNTLRRGARHFYGATEGAQVIKDIWLYNSGACGPQSCGGQPCDICFRSDLNTGLAPLCAAGEISLYYYYWNSPQGFSHELGHQKFCAQDEYTSFGGNHMLNCGHSVMAQHDTDNKNFCIPSDHLHDGTPGANQYPPTSTWEQAVAAGRAAAVLTETQDNYDYMDFDFNNTVGAVTLK
jgi:hypothetical protein